MIVDIGGHDRYDSAMRPGLCLGAVASEVRMIDCLCGSRYDPVRYRWRCPACGLKATCCEGEPCEIPDAPDAGKS